MRTYLQMSLPLPITDIQMSLPLPITDFQMSLLLPITDFQMSLPLPITDFQMSLPLPITNGPQFICHTQSFTSERILHGAGSAALAAIPIRCESQFNSFIYAYFCYKTSGFTHHI